MKKCVGNVDEYVENIDGAMHKCVKCKKGNFSGE